MANLEAFQKTIEILRGAIPELRAVLIGSTEGLPVAHWNAGGADPARVAAMADRIVCPAGHPRTRRPYSLQEPRSSRPGMATL